MNDISIKILLWKNLIEISFLQVALTIVEENC